MVAIRLDKFLGKAPRMAPELLPDKAAQVAEDAKLYSGDIIPYPQPAIVASHGLLSTPKALYALRDPTDNTLRWLAWTTGVDIATPAAAQTSSEQRFYYTGDGAPKVSTYALATAGAAPYPADYYDLGLPLPTQTPTTSAASFTTVTTASYARDAGGMVTLVTGTAHGLKTGAFITVSGFTVVTGTYSQSGTTMTVTITAHGLAVGARVVLTQTSGGTASSAYTVVTVPDVNTFTVTMATSTTATGTIEWDISGFNTPTVAVTVIDATTITYLSSDFQVATTASTDGKIDLSGATTARTYLYTWFTPWSEESVGSDPADALFIKEGQVVTVSGLPTAAPSGKNQIRGLRLYRTLSSTSDTAYLRLATLWFPTGLSTVQRSGSTATVTTAYPHNLTVGDYFKVGSCSDASFDVSGGVVLSTPDASTFTYASSGSATATAPVTAGTLYHDVSETPGVTPARYWGDGSYDFTDDFAVASLLNSLNTDDYEPPPAGLDGLVVYNNNVLVGFVGNELYFSEPGEFHAWPRRYKITIPYGIVGLSAASGYLFVATESYPYLVAGGDPAVLNTTRIDALYPCLNKRSMVNMGFGVVYATHDGLVLYSTTSGPQLLTKAVYNSDTWNADLDPTTLVAAAYKDSYLAWHDAGGISFERDQQAGGFFVDLTTSVAPTATWYDAETNAMYFTHGTAGSVYQWDDPAQSSQTFRWKSKVLTTPAPINMGAAQVLADFSNLSLVWGASTDVWGTSTALWSTGGGVVFKFWADGTLLYTNTVTGGTAFRLPAGYKADNFEVEVSAAVRLRAIKLAETPIGLKGV